MQCTYITENKHHCFNIQILSFNSKANVLVKSHFEPLKAMAKIQYAFNSILYDASKIVLREHFFYWYF